MRYKLCLAALAASVAVASPAFAQSVPVSATDQAEARGVVLLPLTLTKTQDLDFGTVIASPTVAGQVTIDADSGNRTVNGGVTGVPSYPGDRALFQGAGTVGQVVVLTLNAPGTLTSGSNSINASIVLDQGGLLSRTIDSSGAFAVGVGGTFDIAAAQPNGLYSATFDLTAEYQ